PTPFPYTTLFRSRAVGNGLSVIAGGERHDPALPFVVAQVMQAVDRATHLERAGALERLDLEEYGGTDPVAQRTGSKYGCAVHVGIESAPGLADVVYVDHSGMVRCGWRTVPEAVVGTILAPWRA